MASMPPQLVKVIAPALALGVCAIATSGPGSAANAGKTCPVTVPKPADPKAAPFSAASFNYGNARIRAEIYWPRGTLLAGPLPGGGSMASINPDGSIDLKLGWWRGVPGKLVIRGRRLDASAPLLLAYVPYGYGDVGFIPSGLTFPTVGCWRVVGKQGGASLTFVVKVTKVK